MGWQHQKSPPDLEKKWKNFRGQVEKSTPYPENISKKFRGQVEKVPPYHPCILSACPQMPKVTRSGTPYDYSTDLGYDALTIKHLLKEVERQRKAVNDAKAEFAREEKVWRLEPKRFRADDVLRKNHEQTMSYLKWSIIAKEKKLALIRKYVAREVAERVFYTAESPAYSPTSPPYSPSAATNGCPDGICMGEECKCGVAVMPPLQI